MINLEIDEATGIIHAFGSVALPSTAPAPSPPASTPARGIWMGRTDFGDELITAIPLTKGLNYLNPYTGGLGYYHRILYTLPLPTLMPGDVVDARTTFELTNGLNFNVMACRFIVITDLPQDPFKVVKYLSRPAGRNVTTNMHHDIVHDFGTFKVEEEMEAMSVSVIVYAASFSAVTGHTLKVEQNYGRLEVKVYPAEMVQP